MDDNEPVDVVGASAGGIVECLRMLADEAASLQLVRTLNALRHALDTCMAERSAGARAAEDGQEHHKSAALSLH